MKKLYRKTLRKFSDFTWKVRRFFYPCNVIRCQSISREWIDRDGLMFHAMFQILVDFVELEHDFVPFEDRYASGGRYTDLAKMKDYLEKHYGPDIDYDAEWGNGDYNWSDETYRESTIKWVKSTYKAKKEILYLYEWYKYIYQNRINPFDYQNISDINIENNFEIIHSSKPDITSSESHEITEEYEMIENIMLHRLLNIRQYLWTQNIAFS